MEAANRRFLPCENGSPSAYARVSLEKGEVAFHHALREGHAIAKKNDRTATRFAFGQADGKWEEAVKCSGVARACGR
jgi:hypothetical protein